MSDPAKSKRARRARRDEFLAKRLKVCQLAAIIDPCAAVSRYEATQIGTSGGAESLSETKSRDGRPVVRRYDRETAAKIGRSASRKVDYARRRRNAGIALVAGLLLAVMAVWYLDSQDEILRGVSIGEVEVGGMTRAEARQAVESRASATFERSGSETGCPLLGEQLGVQVDAASATEEAFSIGRQGWIGSACSTSCTRTSGRPGRARGRVQGRGRQGRGEGPGGRVLPEAPECDLPPDGRRPGRGPGGP